MKKFFTTKCIIGAFATIILFFVANQAIAALPVLSADTVSYGYDLTGNRIFRGIIYLKSTRVTDTVDYKDNLDKTRIIISPNPNGGRFTLTVTGNTRTDSMKIFLYNLSGNLIFKRQKTEVNTEIDISNRPNGMYILYLIIGNKTKTWKIIKE